MAESGKSNSFRPASFTVRDFYEAGRDKLSLEILAGSATMDRVIEEPILNRPGLAMTGFLDNFESRRIQVIGNAEAAYLASLDLKTRLERVRAVLALRPALMIFTDGNKPAEEGPHIADEFGVTVMRTTMPTRPFTHQSLFILDRLSAPRTKIYGTMMEVCGLGVLFEGAPGLGKSETALGLMRRGYALIADDLTCIRKDISRDTLFGSASKTTGGFMEIRGIGIIDVPSIFGVDALRGEKRLDLVITFKPLDEVRHVVDRIGQRQPPKEILGVKVPNILLPVSEGRDLVNLVETAAQQHKLILAGHDPATQLSQRLRSIAAGNHLTTYAKEGETTNG